MFITFIVTIIIATKTLKRQCNRIVIQETDPCIYGQLIIRPRYKGSYMLKSLSFQQIVLEQLEIHMKNKNKNLNASLTPYVEVSTKWIDLPLPCPSSQGKIEIIGREVCHGGWVACSSILYYVSSPAIALVHLSIHRWPHGLYFISWLLPFKHWHLLLPNCFSIFQVRLPEEGT